MCLTLLIDWLVDYNSPGVILGREAEDILSALALDGRPGDVHGVKGTGKLFDPGLYQSRGRRSVNCYHSE